MTRRELVLTSALVVLAALLLANLLRPVAPQAYDLVPQAPPVAISSSGDAAWALIGNRIYYVSLRQRGEVTNRTITQIDALELK